MYLPSEDASDASTSQAAIPENNFNVPQTTSDAYPNCKTPEENFSPVYDVSPSVAGRVAGRSIIEENEAVRYWDHVVMVGFLRRLVKKIFIA